MKSEYCIIIPAIKKNGVIPDQLIKKLNGITLIQRAINTAKEVGGDIYVVTDSQEISLIAERNGVKYIYNPQFRMDEKNIFDNFRNFLQELQQYENFLIYRANTPLVDSDILISAYREFLENREKTLISVREEKRFAYLKDEDGKYIRTEKNLFSEINSFIITSSKNLFSNRIDFHLYPIPSEKAIEIENFQDWWVAEKLLQRKKIIINVFGSTNLGMGHIYRSLALAHEITDHQIVFVCRQKYRLAVSQIASKDYKVIATDDVEKTILNEKPDLVINDVLNTDEKFIRNLKKIAKVVNFEDLGSGADWTDITINELYEYPVRDGTNYRWGHQYYFLRDEFENARPHQFIEDVEAVLISFGGSDRNNLTQLAFSAVLPIAKRYGVRINIVCGGGYIYKEQLEKTIADSGYSNIYFTYSSGVISKIMEQSQIAISSNGRTVYELADMNIPSIVISQHEREATHSFAQLQRGFINLGVVRDGIEKEIAETFEKLLTDKYYRELLFLNIEKYSFRENKRKVVNMILELLD